MAGWPVTTGCPRDTLTCRGMVQEATSPEAGADTDGAAAEGDGRGATGAELEDAVAGLGTFSSMLRQAGSQSLVETTLPVKFKSGATRRSRASSYIGTA